MHDASLLTTVAAAFTAAWILGLITQKLKLSPIVGYLLAGIAIGPFTPGYTGDVEAAGQLAEVGIILLMFGVGLHFHLAELLAVRTVAIPGAVGQSLVATALGAVVGVAFGWPLKSGLVLGMAMAVASTVVLIRVLTDNRLLDTSAGHVAVGWTIVEDLLTVVVLVLVPAMGTAPSEHGSLHTPANIWLTLLISLGKLAVLVAIMFLAGSKLIPWVMVRVARLRSRELFTLTVLVMAIAVAVGSSYAFGASMALGAFLAGMVVGQSPVSQQAAADALPLRDAFAVLFFVSVGMLFDPRFLLQQPWLVLAGVSVVVVGKPLIAFAIVVLIGYPIRTALTIALALGQIGEFSFILSETGHRYGLMNEAGHNLLVACAIISITLNPLLFRLIGPIESALRRSPALWRFANRRTRRRESQMNEQAGELIERSDESVAVIVGYGPVGRAIDSILQEIKLRTVVVDLNMDTVQGLTKKGRPAIYGDAFNIEVMHQALARASHLIITLPHSTNRNPLIASAKLINPAMKVFVRARYLSERPELEQVGADAVCYEEAEAAVTLARLVLFDRGADADVVRRETIRLRQDLVASDSSKGG